MTWIMGRDQYGTTYHDLGKHPRKALLDRLGRKSAAIMWCDMKEGPPKRQGYVIAGHWITLYAVSEYRGEK